MSQKHVYKQLYSESSVNQNPNEALFGWSESRKVTNVPRCGWCETWFSNFSLHKNLTVLKSHVYHGGCYLMYANASFCRTNTLFVRGYAGPVYSFDISLKRRKGPSFSFYVLFREHTWEYRIYWDSMSSYLIEIKILWQWFWVINASHCKGHQTSLLPKPKWSIVRVNREPKGY